MLVVGGISDKYDGILCGSLLVSSASSITDKHDLHSHLQMNRKVLCVCRLLFVVVVVVVVVIVVVVAVVVHLILLFICKGGGIFR